MIHTLNVLPNSLEGGGGDISAASGGDNEGLYGFEKNLEV